MILNLQGSVTIYKMSAEHEMWLYGARGLKSALFSMDSVDDSNIMLVWTSGKLSVNFVAITFWSSYVCHEPLLWETCMSLVFTYMLFIHFQAFEPLPRDFEQRERLVNSECDCCVSKPFCSIQNPKILRLNSWSQQTTSKRLSKYVLTKFR